MSKRAKIRTVSFLTALFLVLGGAALQQRHTAQTYRHQLTIARQHAFAELADQLEGLDSALQKSQYATSPALFSSLCAEIYSRASAAQLSLGELPWSNVELEQTAAFLSQTGDYAWALTRSVTDVPPSREARETLAGLAAASGELTRRISHLQEALNQGTFSLESVAQVEAQLSATGGSQVTANPSFQDVEEEFPELPSLIYDGPFSEHLTVQTPQYLQGKVQATEEEARRAAAAFLDSPAEELELMGIGGGSLPTYGFSLAEEDLYLEVTRQGGVVVELLSGQPEGQAQVFPESALAIARNFLLERGYMDMSETYHIRQGGKITVNFSWQDGDVLCYSDLIKVTVALDTGDVTGFEAHGYVMNHRKRDLPSPSISQAEARTVVPDALTILAHQLALIPTSGKNEILCHEFKCQTGDGQHILIYVNAQTGQEEKILLLLEDENGTLVK